MGSMYAKLKQERTLGSANTSKLSDFDDTDPYYFLVIDGGRIVAEGDLLQVKLKLDESYLNKPIKQFSRDRITMTTTIKY